MTRQGDGLATGQGARRTRRERRASTVADLLLGDAHKRAPGEELQYHRRKGQLRNSQTAHRGPETDFYDDSEFRIFAEIR